MDEAMSAILPGGNLPLGNMWGGSFINLKILLKKF